MRHWRCKVCGHIFRGTESPEKCPHCSAPQEMFHSITDENEHAYITTGQKVVHTDNVEIQPFFGNFEHLAPYIYTIPVGDKILSQKHPFEEMLYIIKGYVKCYIGDHEFIAQVGDALQVKKDVIHLIENISNEPSIILAVKGSKNI